MYYLLWNYSEVHTVKSYCTQVHKGTSAATMCRQIQARGLRNMVWRGQQDIANIPIEEHPVFIILLFAQRENIQ